MPRFLTKIKYIGEDSTEHEVTSQAELGIEDTENGGIQTANASCNVTKNYANALGLGLSLTNCEKGAFCVGQYNEDNEDKSGILFSVGYGNSNNARKNIFEVCSDGNVKIYPTSTESDCAATIKDFKNKIADNTLSATFKVAPSVSGTNMKVKITKLAPLLIDWGDGTVSVPRENGMAIEHEYVSPTSAKTITLTQIFAFGPQCVTGENVGSITNVSRGSGVRALL